MCTLLYLAKLSGLVECCPLKGQWPNPAAMLRIVCLTEFWCLWNNLHKYVGIVDSLKKKARELRGGRRNLLYRQRLLWKASEKRCLQYWTIQLNLWTQRKYKKKFRFHILHWLKEVVCTAHKPALGALGLMSRIFAHVWPCLHMSMHIFPASGKKCGFRSTCCMIL